MAGIADGDHAHAVLLCFFDRHRHGFETNDLSHAVVTVNDGGGGGFLQNFEIGDGVLNTCFDSVDIDRLEAVASVRFDAAAVAFKQNVCTDTGILCRYARADESIRDERFGGFPIKINFCHEFLLYLLQ